MIIVTYAVVQSTHCRVRLVPSMSDLMMVVAHSCGTYKRPTILDIWDPERYTH